MIASLITTRATTIKEQYLMHSASAQQQISALVEDLGDLEDTGDMGDMGDTGVTMERSDTKVIEFQ